MLRHFLNFYKLKMLTLLSLLILVIAQIVFLYAIRFLIQENNLISRQNITLGKGLKKKFKSKTIIFASLLVFLINIAFIIFLINYISVNSEFLALQLMFIIFLIIFHLISVFLIVFDLLILEVPEFVIKLQILITIVCSIIYSTLSLFTQDLNNLNFQLGGFGNLIGMTLGFLYSFILVKCSNEKFLGEGDVYFFSAIGLIIGYKQMVIFLLLFPIVGTIYGLSNAVILRKFRSLLIPLFPVLYIAFLIILVFQNQINSFLFL